MCFDFVLILRNKIDEIWLEKSLKKHPTMSVKLLLKCVACWTRIFTDFTRFWSPLTGSFLAKIRKKGGDPKWPILFFYGFLFFLQFWAPKTPPKTPQELPLEPQDPSPDAFSGLETSILGSPQVNLDLDLASTLALILNFLWWRFFACNLSRTLDTACHFSKLHVHWTRAGGIARSV